MLTCTRRVFDESGRLIGTETFKVSEAECNAPILQQLDELDRKTVRALRAGETNRLAEYEAQAAALRAQLLPVTIS